ncbi:MAG: mechanosensitive ion channel family protein [Myxococcota bacterium]|nr:mechanosensitive ion channel family protein [Myxococcota bacterium]
MDGVSVSPELFQYLHPEKIPYALLWLLAAWALVRFITGTFDRLGDRFTHRRLLLKQVAAVLRFVVCMGFSGIAASTVVELTDQALLAISGTAAVAIAFAVRDLLASLIAGIILLFDRPFQVGDRVQFGDAYGEVVEMGLRSVRIATLDDNLVSIPNNLFLTSVVSSANAGALDQMCVFSFDIGCNEDFDLAKQIVYEATASSSYVYLNKPITILLDEGPVPDGAERFAIRIRAKAYVLDGRYESAFSTDVTERVLRAFRRHGVRTAGQIEWGPPGSGS